MLGRRGGLGHMRALPVGDSQYQGRVALDGEGPCRRMGRCLWSGRVGG